MKDGREYDVVYPNRLGHEQETSWLDAPGCREWNVDFVDMLNRYTGQGHRLIVGEWGTGYLDNNFKFSINLDQVSHSRQLTSDLQKQADDAALTEKLRRQEEFANDPTRFIRNEEFKLLERRLQLIEEIVHRNLT
jgi:hypothetical protein